MTRSLHQRLTRTFNFATPFGGVLVFLALAAFVWLSIYALGFRFDPFDTAAKRIDRLERQVVTHQIDAAARTIEVAGERDTAQRVDAAHRQIRHAETIAAEITAQARTAPDADEPLSPDRSARLRRADQRLCETRPAVCAPDAAAPGHAVGSHNRLQPAGPS